MHKELAGTKADLERTQREAAQHNVLVGELREDLRNAEREIERLQKLAPPSPAPRDSAGRRSSSASSLEDPSATREQIVGLKSIIETLTEENKQLVDRNKAIVGETDSLKCVALSVHLFRTRSHSLTLDRLQGCATRARVDGRKVRPKPCLRRPPSLTSRFSPLPQPHGPARRVCDRHASRAFGRWRQFRVGVA